MTITEDRIRGMLMGAFLGDALGAPHEFRCNANVPYTGVLEQAGFMISRFQGRKDLKVGQVTDDSEMTITLLRSLLDKGGYDRTDVLENYMAWANVPGTMMGRNTRALLKGIKTIRGYENRIAKIHALPPNDVSQSNGGLMRASPLALLNDNHPAAIDTGLTNPSPITVDTTIVYVCAVRLALQGVNVDRIMEILPTLASTSEVREVIQQVQNRTPRNLAENKGWCLHGLWSALTLLTQFTDYADGINYIISSHPGSDTDTNACIAGALLGAHLGYQAMVSNPVTADNVERLLAVDPEAEPHSRPVQLVILSQLTMWNGC
jgi:ADP-ribosylglycohydrolase